MVSPMGKWKCCKKIVGIIQDEPLRQEMIDARNDTELLALLKKAVFKKIKKSRVESSQSEEIIMKKNF
ncbi:hypothetical protein JG559_01140 [Enterococcus faecalis]|uniref:Uncharacterized protein n=1 Tax=Enterococcus faecalis TaxID=1351 RepID=A0A974NZN0_ENTFL|nr:hypothetical protein JG559_01140 [Enterococcus faecalis]